MSNTKRKHQTSPSVQFPISVVFHSPLLLLQKQDELKKLNTKKSRKSPTSQVSGLKQISNQLPLGTKVGQLGKVYPSVGRNRFISPRGPPSSCEAWTQNNRCRSCLQKFWRKQLWEATGIYTKNMSTCHLPISNYHQSHFLLPTSSGLFSSR